MIQTFTEAVVQRCSVKKVFLKISQNSLKNTYGRVSFLITLKNTYGRVSFLITLQALPATLLENKFQHRCFPVNFVKFLRILFLIEHLWWLLLPLMHISEYKIFKCRWQFWDILGPFQEQLFFRSERLNTNNSIIFEQTFFFQDGRLS